MPEGSIAYGDRPAARVRRFASVIPACRTRHAAGHRLAWAVLGGRAGLT